MPCKVVLAVVLYDTFRTTFIAWPDVEPTVIHGDVNAHAAIVQTDFCNIAHSDFLAQTGEET